ncbi:hypothetical protein IC235_15015 [Hymenobacter sp. BT664]|uniref:Uncharacterized protein n=1 Tax=Hymenobacter montanus TaxID=2771359 RepID=A0A927BF07_9BACT|nr:hypothetical protein [Hymenobacter montanus]MBD2769201.1 hypothetical protein [Hymenobacter montanus]
MRLIERIEKAENLFRIGEQIFVATPTYIIDLASGRSVDINPLNGWHSGNFFYKMLPDKVSIYDTSFNQRDFLYKDVEGVVVLDTYNIILFVYKGIERQYYITGNQVTEKKGPWWGHFLNKDYQFHYDENVSGSAKHFRCSNLLDTQTYWEYECLSGEHIIKNDFYLYNDMLLFLVTKPRERNDVANSNYIIVLDLNTGKEVRRLYTRGFNNLFDPVRGWFITIYADTQLHGEQKWYEIIDVNTGGTFFGGLNVEEPLYWVSPAVASLSDNKVYFADRSSRPSELIDTVPRIGCFNIETRKVEVCVPIPEADSLSINQILYNKGLWYLRTGLNEVLVFEE